MATKSNVCHKGTVRKSHVGELESMTMCVFHYQPSTLLRSSWAPRLSSCRGQGFPNTSPSPCAPSDLCCESLARLAWGSSAPKVLSCRGPKHQCFEIPKLPAPDLLGCYVPGLQALGCLHSWGKQAKAWRANLGKQKVGGQASKKSLASKPKLAKQKQSWPSKACQAKLGKQRLAKQSWPKLVQESLASKECQAKARQAKAFQASRRSLASKAWQANLGMQTTSMQTLASQPWQAKSSASNSKPSKHANLGKPTLASKAWQAEAGKHRLTRLAKQSWPSQPGQTRQGEQGLASKGLASKAW